MNRSISIFVILLTCTQFATSSIAGVMMFDGAAGTPGSLAIAHTDPRFVDWAVGGTVQRGLQDIGNSSGGLASFGDLTNAFGPAGTSTGAIVSLGDGGSATLTFNSRVRNGAGPDFAVFENSFSDTYLELAYVEVSSDGSNFFRFPSISMTQASMQVGSFENLDPTNLFNLAGKYRVGFGTPFDLQELVGTAGLDVDHVGFVRVVDVVGRINPAQGYSPSLDSLGNIINDPYATAFISGGFDLDGIGVINAVPEPTSLSLVVVLGMLTARRRIRKKQA